MGFNSSSVVNAKACRLKYFLPDILSMVAVENPFASSNDLTSSLQNDLAKYSIFKRSLYASLIISMENERAPGEMQPFYHKWTKSKLEYTIMGTNERFTTTTIFASIRQPIVAVYHFPFNIATLNNPVLTVSLVST